MYPVDTSKTLAQWRNSPDPPVGLKDSESFGKLALMHAHAFIPNNAYRCMMPSAAWRLRCCTVPSA